MRPLVWVMKKQRISGQQIGLSIFIVILLVGWAINGLLSFQGELGSVERGNDILIRVTGVVHNPGVYSFDGEPSLKELIARAGGLEIKLLCKDWDTYASFAHGTSVHISSEHGYIKVSSGSIPAAYKVTLEIPISLNTATLEELDAIPEIGPALGSNIIDYRSRYGPFTTVEELKNIPGVGKVRYSIIKPFVKI